MFGGKIMNLSREQSIAEHRKMWNWIADETEKLKRRVGERGYFLAMGIRKIPFVECYCCNFCHYNPECCNERCIIDWGEGIRCVDSYYKEWLCADDWKEAARLARIIANLPEREVSD